MRPEDAALAARAGADAIGMVFHPPARRNVSLEQAQAIVAALPVFVTPVALFVDADPGRICQVCHGLGISHVQLNGHEPPQLIRELAPLRVIKSVPVVAESFEADLATWRQTIDRLNLSNLAGLVLETANTGAPGGSGVANDWATVVRAQEGGHFAGLPPIIAAGGLTPESVADVVTTLRPFAVDVSSGVEHALGQKSPHKIDAFVAAVHAADAAASSGSS